MVGIVMCKERIDYIHSDVVPVHFLPVLLLRWALARINHIRYRGTLVIAHTVPLVRSSPTKLFKEYSLRQ